MLMLSRPGTPTDVGFFVVCVSLVSGCSGKERTFKDAPATNDAAVSATSTQPDAALMSTAASDAGSSTLPRLDASQLPVPDAGQPTTPPRTDSGSMSTATEADAGEGTTSTSSATWNDAGTCSTESDCGPPKSDLGEACQTNADCASDHCADGVCCNSECAGQCQTCADPQSAGQCQTVTGAAPADKLACNGQDRCQGVCDGISPECVYPGMETVCSPASCSDTTGEALSTAVCQSDGSCGSPTTTSCGNRTCDGDVCREKCEHDGQCRTGTLCVDGLCIEYQKRQVLVTSRGFSPGKGLVGADDMCQSEFGGADTTFKALLVGGGRTATVTPYKGDYQEDWVIQPYTQYYNFEGRLLWTTDAVALLGVRGGKREKLLEPATPPYAYPWSGYATDWTTVPDETCAGWTNGAFEYAGAFAFDDLTYAATEPCDRAEPLICVEQ